MLIRSDHLRWLFWLRWTLFKRRFTTGRGRVWRIVSIVIALVSIALFGAALAVVFFLGFRFLPPPANAELLFLLLTGIYLLWISSPLLGFNTNEGLDLSKLSLFPLTRLELMASLVISTLLDVPTVGLVFIFAAVVAGWAVSLPLALFAVLALLVFYIQLIGSSQLVLALLTNFLRSRRLRDLAVILTALLSFSGYLWQFAVRGLDVRGSHILQALEHAPYSPYLQWTPPGMAARALQQASLGHWGASFAWLGSLVVVSFLVLFLWLLLVKRSLVARRSNGSLAIAETSTRRSVPARVWSRILPAQSLAIMVKDAKYYWREPQIKVRVMRSFLYIFLPLLYLQFGLHVDAESFFSQWRLLYLPFLVFLSLSSFSHNALGYEQLNLNTLLIFPIEPRHLLWGKNLLVFLLGFCEMALAVLIIAFLTHSWDQATPAFIAGVAGFGVVLGFGNLSSVFFPSPVFFNIRNVRSATNVNASADQGCLNALKPLGMLLVEFVVLSPVLAALILPVLFHARWIWLVAIPASLVYSITVYVLLTAWAASRLIARTPEILARVTRWQ